MNILGIDSGLTGGLVWCCNRIILGKWVTPLDAFGDIDPFKIYDILESISPDTIVYLEKVGAYAMNQSSAFTFGRVYGQTELITRLSRLTLRFTSPAEWSKVMHEGIDKRLKPKEKSLIALQQRFPGWDMRATERSKKPHDGLVDALLIAEYGRIQEEKILKAVKEMNL